MSFSIPALGFVFNLSFTIIRGTQEDDDRSKHSDESADTMISQLMKNSRSQSTLSQGRTALPRVVQRVRRKAGEERGPGWMYSLSSKKGGTHYVHVRQPRR